MKSGNLDVYAHVRPEAQPTEYNLDPVSDVAAFIEHLIETLAIKQLTPLVWSKLVERLALGPPQQFRNRKIKLVVEHKAIVDINESCHFVGGLHIICHKIRKPQLVTDVSRRSIVGPG
jgi:hypothetical protein